MTSDAGVTRHEQPAEDSRDGRADVNSSAKTRHERDTPGDAEATRYEGASRDGSATAAAESPTGPRKWLILPDAVLADYEYLEDISTRGAQADVVLCRHRSRGTLVAIKLYRASEGALDPSALEELRQASPQHVVPILEVGSGQGRVWEVQEYFPRGSLQRLLGASPSGLPEVQVRSLVVELTNAISHIHRLGIIHRDLKPDNVLVRSQEPLDLVLGDFGIARQQAVTQVAGSIAGAMAFMAPEASFGLTSRPGDWWALGIMVHQALTGRHLFADSSGVDLLPEMQIRVALGQGSYAVGELPDERWVMLVQGLLTWSADDRWGEAQIRAWLRGESPHVAPHHVGPSAPGHGPGRTVPPFPFANASHSTPAQLAAAFRRDTEGAAKFVASERDAARLGAWLKQHGLGEPVTVILGSGADPAVAVLSLQLVMDPSHAPAYRSVPLDTPALSALAEQAEKGDERAVSWIRTVRHEQILAEWGATDESAKAVAVIDDSLRRWWRGIDRLSPPALAAVSEARDKAEGVLLHAAIDQTFRADLVRRNAKTLSELKGLPEAFTAHVRLAASDLSEDGLGVRTLFAAQVAQERAREQQRRAVTRREQWSMIRQRARGNFRAGAINAWWWSLIFVAPIGLAAFQLTYGRWISALAQDLGPWWLGLVLTGGVLRVFSPRSHVGLRWLAAGCASLWWAGQAFAEVGRGMSSVPASLWHSAIVAMWVTVVAGWLGGFLPRDAAMMPRQMPSARADRAARGFTRLGASLLGGVWLLLLTRLFAVTLRTQSAPVLVGVNAVLPDVKRVVGQLAYPIAERQPAWMMPSGATAIFVLGGLLLVGSRHLRLPVRARPLPGFVTSTALLFVLVGNLGWLWLPLSALALMGLVATARLTLGWLLSRA
jgi:hypothetical protein